MNPRMLLIFFALICMMLITPAEAKTWYVDDSGGANLSEIIDAVNSASSGDTIFVYAGTYLGFDVNKPDLNIIGESADVVTVAPNAQGQYEQLRLPDSGKNATGTVLKGMKIRSLPMLGSFGPALDCIIRNCVFSEVGANEGIEIAENNCTFENNVVSNSTGTYCALHVNGKSCIFSSNIFINNLGAGLSIYSEAINTTVTKNTFSSNAYAGIEFYDTVGVNSIYLNNFIGNGVPATTSGTAAPALTQWNSTTPIKYTYNGQTYTGYMGNYWSDYIGTDANSDGIGDVPYVLPDNLGTDNYPLMQPFENYFNVEPFLTTIEVTPATANLTTGSTQQFTAGAKDQYGNMMSNITFNWSSSNEAVGTVNSTGFFTSLAGGTTTVTASAEGVNGTAQATVEAPATATISVSPLSSSLTPGGTQQFSAVAKDQAGNIMLDVAFTWSNDNENIGTVDESGLFTAKGFGTATVTAANGAVNSTAQANVTRTDLVANAIDANSPVHGKAGTVSVTVRNAGPAATGSFNVSLLADNTEFGQSMVNSLGINESSSAVVSWTPSSAGEVNLTAVVDPENAIDLNTANNVLSKTVTVTSSSPDLSVSAASFATTYPLTNNTLNVNVTNSGGGNAAAFKVTLQIGETSTTVNIPELASGNNTTISIKDIKREVGSVPVNIKIDPENSIVESDETNNECTTTATIAGTGSLFMGGRFSSGRDLVNNAVYKEGNIGVRVAEYGSYTWFTHIGTVTYTADELKVPADATIKSARLYQGWTWYANPHFTVEFNGHKSQEPETVYSDWYTGLYVFDVMPYFNATGDNTAVITAVTDERGYYGTVLVVIYEAASEPYRQIWVNEGSDCIMYGSNDPYDWAGYTMFYNATTDNTVSAKVTNVLQSGDNDDQKTILFNGQIVPKIGKEGTDPAFFYYDVTSAMQSGPNEMGVRGGGDSYFNFAVSVLENTKVTASEANFSANTTDGHAPLTVKFTDTSTGTPTNRTWDFGDGGTSNEQNPTHTYTAEGTYAVKLTVSNSLGSDEEVKNGYITVGSAVLAPEASFSANMTSGLAPLTVQFTDESTNTPTSWEWDFGDGKTSIEQNPSHTYETLGTYTVKLIATNYGGSNSTTKTDYITVTSDVSAPIVNFTMDANSGQVPFTVYFTDTSTGSVSNWKWNFGDGGTSTEQNPTHTYVTEGSYNVNLTATGPGGSNTTTLPIIVSAPLTANSYNGGIPLTTVQRGTVSGGLWYDSYSAMETSAQKTFNLPAYTDIKWARLYVDVYDGHMQSNYRGNVTIGIDADGDSTYEIQKQETFNTAYSFPGEGGTGPVWVNDHMNRVTSDYLMWYDLTNAIEGKQVNVQAESAKVDSNFDGRVKAMTLVVAYDDGDSDQVYYWVNQGHDTVNPLDTEYSGSSSFGTSSLTSGWSSANLTAIYLASVDGKYTFQGTELTSGVKTGPYYGSNTWEISSLLTAGQDSALAYNKQGSDDYFKIPLALMSIKHPAASPTLPEAAFTADVTSGDTPLTVNFTDQSTGSPTSWFWDFGDGATATEQNVSHTYTTAGNYTVNLTVSNEAGSGSEVKTEYIVVSEPLPGAPIANFTAAPTLGNAPLTVNFTDASVGNVSSYAWDFNNDGNVDSTEQSPSYTYDAAGTYDVKLTIIGPGGSDSEVKTEYINVSSPILAKPVAAFSASSTLGIIPLNVSFTDMSSGVPTSWSWNFGDGNNSTEQNPSHTYGKVGKFTVSLTVKNKLGTNTTRETSYIHIEIVPVAEFSANKTLGKVPLGVKFTDRSTGVPTSWFWDFGDGNTSTEKTPVHVYGAVGKYDVTLTATNAVGNNTITKYSYIDVEVVPLANFTADPTVGIMPLSVSFTDLSSGTPTSWKWNFGDGTNSTEQNPSHIYSKVGKFTVSLKAKNAVGSNTSKRIKYIDVEVVPVANFTANKTVGKLPMSVKFTDRSSGAPTSWNWDFGDGNTSTEKSPTNVYGAVGRYNVTLTATNAVGSNTFTRYSYIDVEIVPVSDFSADPTVGANPLNVSFTDLSTGAPTSWTWDFGDKNNSTEQNPSHVYSKGGQYTVKLIAKNAVGSNTSTKTKLITVESIPVASFSAPPTTGTAPLNVSFTDKSTGYPENWYWEFGDGTTSTEQKPVHTYSMAGKYTVNLTVTNLAGSSTKSMSNYVRVF